MATTNDNVYEAYRLLTTSTLRELEEIGGALESAIASVIPHIIELVKQKCKDPQHLEDFFQAGLLGAGKAYKRFTTARGARFSTYAHYSIVKEMNDLTRELILVPMSVHDMERRCSLYRAAKQFHEVFGRTPGVEELTQYAIEIGGKGCQMLTPEKVRRLLNYKKEPEYMDAPVPGQDPSITMGDVLAYVYFDMPYTPVAA